MIDSGNAGSAREVVVEPLGESDNIVVTVVASARYGRHMQCDQRSVLPANACGLFFQGRGSVLPDVTLAAQNVGAPIYNGEHVAVVADLREAETAEGNDIEAAGSNDVRQATHDPAIRHRVGHHRVSAHLQRIMVGHGYRWPPDVPTAPDV